MCSSGSRAIWWCLKFRPNLPQWHEHSGARLLHNGDFTQQRGGARATRASLPICASPPPLW